jgi:hypothetical protein
MSSLYGIDQTTLKRMAMNLQIGQGIMDRLTGVDSESFIEEGERWAEQMVNEYMGVPLKPIPAPGETTIPDPVTSRNFPLHFIYAATYFGLARLLASEFFENQANASESAKWAEEKALEHIGFFRESRATSVGRGRLRHINPFMPPNIAQKPPGT